MAHPERIPRRTSVAVADAPSKTPKKAFTAGAWEEARALIWTHRKRLALGLGLMLINRLAGFVLDEAAGSKDALQYARPRDDLEVSTRA